MIPRRGEFWLSRNFYGKKEKKMCEVISFHIMIALARASFWRY